MLTLSRRLWAIHNPLKSWTLAGLSLRECQLLVASMTDAEMKISWVHRKGWADWKPLGDDECHSLFQHNDSGHHECPSLPALMAADDRDHDITQVRSTTSAPKFIEPVTRKFQRFTARLPVDILVGPHSFSTHTVDLSEGGFLFEDPLPEWVAGYFTVALKMAEPRFEFTCILAEDQKKEKFRAEIAPTTSESVVLKFKHWLADQKYPKTLKSK